MEMRITTYYMIVVCYVLSAHTHLYAQCPSKLWAASNQGAVYVELKGKKTIFNDITNLRMASYTNDGQLHFFGDITNDGFIGDGFGSEYIGTCTNAPTQLSGTGTTEFNKLTMDNQYGLNLGKWMTIKSNLKFNAGIIHSDRKNSRQKTIFGPTASVNGARDDAHVNGVVSKLGTGPFVFPLGDGDHLSPVKVRGNSPFNEFEACYISHNLDSLQRYSKGVYPTDSTAYNVVDVQEQEFWTVDGAAATSVTLYWTDYSRISSLVSNTDDLIVVGWKDNRWVNLGNVQKVEFFGTGTITSRIIRPNEYSAFTFGELDTDGDELADSVDENPYDPCDPDPNTTACANNICLSLKTGVWLEGPLFREGEYLDNMDTRLYDFGYLPGLRPRTILGVASNSGQPYGVAPWLYNGTEGKNIDQLNNIINSDDYPDGVVDWVLVSLRTGTAESTTLCTKAALVMKNGDVVLTEYFDCCNQMKDEYYIVIEHRNHLAVMTPTAIAPDADGVLHFDFRTNQSYSALLGYMQKEIEPGRYAMYAGNGDQGLSYESSRDINSNDNAAWARDNGKHSGYYFQDYDLNGDINVHDKALWAINNGIFTDVEPVNN